MNREKIKTILIALVYISGVPVAYHSAKNNFIRMNTEVNYGQPKFSKADKFCSIGMSLCSWLCVAATEIYKATENWGNEPAN